MELGRALLLVLLSAAFVSPPTSPAFAAEEARDTAGEIACDSRDNTVSKAGEAKECLGKKTGEENAKTNAAGGDDIEAAADVSAESGYSAAKQRVSESCKLAAEGNRRSRRAREGYEAAKERASQAAGDVGAKMREVADEL